jgi:cytochrome b561
MIERYPRMMRYMHWGAAALIVPSLLIGLALGYDLVTPRSPAAAWWRDVHVLLGVSALGVMIMRLVIAWRSTKPPIVGTRAEILAARSAHYALYVLAILMPLSGYASWIAYGEAPKPFGISLPGFGLLGAALQRDKAGEWLWPIHDYGGHALAILLMIHLAAVVRRSWLARNDSRIDGLARMLGGTAARPVSQQGKSS